MFSVTLFFRYAIENDLRVQTQENLSDWSNVQDFIRKGRDWGNVRNVGQGACIEDVIVRVSKEGERGYAFYECSAKDSGYFEPMTSYLS